MCPEGLTFCETFATPDIVYGYCADTTTDATNCGGCGILCEVAQNNDSVCIYGRCKTECAAGKADCNGDARDGCEIRSTAIHETAAVAESYVTPSPVKRASEAGAWSSHATRSGPMQE